MPAVTKVVFYADDKWPDEHVEAAEIVRVTVIRQPVGGGEPVRRAAELYLTGGAAAELDKGLDPWMTMGHAIGSSPAVEDVGTGTGRRSKNLRFGPQDTPKGSKARRDWWQGMRDWADGLGLRNPKDPGKKAYQTTTGKDYPPVDLAEGYTLHLQGREAEALAKVARFRPREEAA